MDKNNHLVSQWNAYGEPDENGHFKSSPPKNGFTHDQESQIVNGNSVNYAEKDGRKHYKIDSDSVNKYDFNIRKVIMKNWDNPSNDSQSEKYFSTEKSESYANSKLEVQNEKKIN